MPSFPEISSLTQPPAAVAAQRILAAYLSHHKLAPTAAAELAAALNRLLSALVAGRPGAATVPRLVLQPADEPAYESVPLDEIVEEDALAEDEMDEVKDDAPDVAPRPRRAARTKAAKAVTAQTASAPEPIASPPGAPEPGAPEPAAPEPAASARKPARKKAVPVDTPVTADTSPKPRRAKKSIATAPAAPAPSAAEPVAAVRRRKPKAVAESQSALDLQVTPETKGEAPAAAAEPAPAVEAKAEVVTKAAEPTAPPAAAPRPILRASFASQPAASQPAAPRPILRAPQAASPQPGAPQPAMPVRAPVVEDEDYDPYLGGPLPKSAIAVSAPPLAPQPAAHNGAPTGGKKKRKRPPRPAHQRRAARDALQSGPTPANGGVTDQDDDYDPLI